MFRTLIDRLFTRDRNASRHKLSRSERRSALLHVLQSRTSAEVGTWTSVFRNIVKTEHRRSKSAIHSYLMPALSLEALEERIVLALIGIDFDLDPGFELSPAGWHAVNVQTSLPNLTDEAGNATTVSYGFSLNGMPTVLNDDSVTVSTLPNHANSLANVGKALLGDMAETFTFSGLNPNAPYDVYVFGGTSTVGAGFANDVMIVGGTTINLSQVFTNESDLYVNESIGSSANNLKDFKQTVTADGSGEIKINVQPDAPAAAWALAGLAIEEAMPPMSGGVRGGGVHLTGGMPKLVSDIFAGVGASDLRYLTEVKGTLYFQANDPIHGKELWRSDGTSAGSVLVKDINPFDDSNPSNLAQLNGTLYFTANDGTSGPELWKSDGTATGTVLVKDIFSGMSGSGPNHLTGMNGTLYFTANDGTNGTELWKSDGTASGTVLVKDITPGMPGSDPNFLTELNGTLFFQASDGSNGVELWKSDGTPAGTVLVKDINPGGDSHPTDFTELNGNLFFRADDGVHGSELWRTDGTSAGTVLVRDINPFDDSIPNYLTQVNGTLFFNANDGSTGPELWKSDGTASGTLLVRDIAPGMRGSDPGGLTEANGLLFFSAGDGTTNADLWKSDGTAAGTVLVKDIDCTGFCGPSFLTEVNGTVFFSTYDGSTGEELWRSDGTSTGTVLVEDIRVGSGSSSPRSLTEVNGTLFFSADDGSSGAELWAIPLPEPSMVAMVKDINPVGFSDPVALTEVNGTLFFIADDGGNGAELWKSDGTVAGTVLVKDINPGVGDSSFSNTGFGSYLTEVNGTLFFNAFDVINGPALWKSDGTATGTVLVSNFNGGPPPRFLTEVNGTLFFNRAEPTGPELWKSDGPLRAPYSSKISTQVAAAIPLL